jgi:hypothetical protein
MSLDRSITEFGDEGLRVTHVASLDQVPSPFLDLLTDEHRQAFANPGNYFRRLAAEARVPSMAEWLGYLAGADCCTLEIYPSKYCPAVIVAARTFGFHCVNRLPSRLSEKWSPACSTR